MFEAIKSQLTHASRLVRSAVRDVAVSSKRSDKWPKVRKDFLSKNPTCAACGGSDHLDVHHQRPFHLDPSLELDETNLITLCMGKDKHCHLLLGHGDDFKAFNPNILLVASAALTANKKGDMAAVLDLEAKAKADRKYELAS
jgi:hypothetical protein